MPIVIAQEGVQPPPPPVQQQASQPTTEIDLSQVNKDLNGLEAAPGYGESATVKPVSIWNKLMCCFKRAGRDKNAPKLTREQKKAQKKLKKEQKILQEKEKAREMAEKEWETYTAFEKTRFVVGTIIKFILFIVFLYLFLLSLSFMTIGFTMVTYIAVRIGFVIKFLLSNPFAALAIGIIATAIMQNATATTSIAVSMVGAGIIADVKSAIPIIMGSNIGTCVTNSFIALTMAGEPNEFKRAFSAATLNDGFNLLTTLILLPIEILFGFLDTISLKLSDVMLKGDPASYAGINFVGKIIDPVTNLFIVLDSDAVNSLAAGNRNITETALRCCSFASNDTLQDTIEKWPLYLNTTEDRNLTGVSVSGISFNGCTLSGGLVECPAPICLAQCSYWCMPMLRAFGDGGTGLFWIILSIVVLIASLFSIVKVASLIIVGPIAKGLSRALNASFPGKFKWLTEVVLFIIAFVLTLIVQSSNIITATLVPLCGIGMISLQRVYVMTLGSNIGTTVTGILSAFTSPASTLKKSMQLAFVYTFFNTLGVIFWLPIPPLRFPKRYARKLGNVVFQYRWFLYIYVGTVYFIGPLIMLGLALIPMWIGLAIVGIPLILAGLALLIILILRRFVPKILPEKLKNFDWLPIWMRSLEPYDAKFKQMTCCKSKAKKEFVVERKMSVAGVMEETIVERDVEEPAFIPSMIRRMSAIDSLVAEARVFARKNSIQSHDSSDDESLPDLERRRKSQPTNARRHSLGVSESLPPIPQIEEYQRKRRKTLHKIEPISEGVNEQPEEDSKV